MADTTFEAALSDLQTAKDATTAAQLALEEARAEEAEKLTAVQTALGALVAKAGAMGLTMTASVDAAATDTDASAVSKAVAAVQEKLDEGKAAFAEEAATDPNAARRKLRLIWGCIGLVVGAAAGLGAGWLLWS